MEKYQISEKDLAEHEHMEAQAYFDFLLYSVNREKTAEYKKWEEKNIENSREFISWFLFWKRSHKSLNTLTALTFKQMGNSLRLQPFWSTIMDPKLFPMVMNGVMTKEVIAEFQSFASFLKEQA